MRRKRLIGMVTACAAALALGLWATEALRDTSPSLPTYSPGSGHAEPTLDQATDAIKTAVGLARKELAPDTYRAVTEANEPLAGCEVRALGRGSRVALGDPIAVSDVAGCFPVPVVEDPEQNLVLCVTHPGYVAATVEGPFAGGTVVMRTGVSLHGRAHRDDGSPVDGARILLTRGDLVSVVTGDGERLASGAADAVYSTTTDTRGMFAVGGLKGGEYAVGAAKANMVLVSSGAGDGYLVNAPGADVDLLLADVWGVHARFPDDELMFAYWETPRHAVTSPKVAWQVQRLFPTRKLPGTSFACYAVPEQGAPSLTLVLFGFFRKAGSQRLVLELAPVADMGPPVEFYTHRADSPDQVGYLRVEVRNPSGASVPCSYTLIPRHGTARPDRDTPAAEVSWGLSQRAGTRQPVPFGEYSVQLCEPGLGVQLDPQSAGQTVRVKDTVEQTITIALSAEVLRVKTQVVDGSNRPRLANGSIILTSLAVIPETGRPRYDRPRNIINASELLWWVPKGTYRVRANIRGCAAQELRVEVSRECTVDIFPGNPTGRPR